VRIPTEHDLTGRSARSCLAAVKSKLSWFATRFRVEFSGCSRKELLEALIQLGLCIMQL
jgi:hypothetical protein